MNIKKIFLFLILSFYLKNSFADIDLDDNQEFDFLNSPAKLAQILPEDSKTSVLLAWSKCNDFFDLTQSPTFFINHIIQKVYYNYSEYLKENPEIEKDDEFVLILQDISQFLISGKLDLALKLGFNQDFKTELADILQKVIDLELKLNEKYGDKNCQNFGILFVKEIFEKLANVDLESFESIRQNFIKESQEETITILDAALDSLDRLEKDSENIDNPKLKEAIEFWQNVLKDFEFLRNGESKQEGFFNNKSKKFALLQNMINIAPYAVNSYSLIHSFFELYLRDVYFKTKAENEDKDFNPTDLMKFSVFEFLQGNKLFQVNHNISKDMVLPLVADKALGALMIPFFMLEGIRSVYLSNKDSRNKFLAKKLIWEFSSFAKVLVYYNTLHRVYFATESDKSKTFLWPNSYAPFVKTSWDLTKKTSDICAYLLKSGIENKVGPETLEKIEDRSFGIINTDLIKFLFDTTLPIISYKYVPKSIIDFDRERVLKPASWDWYYVGPKNIAEISDERYIENRIIGYLAVNFGAHIGKELFIAGKGPIKNLAAKIGKYLAIKTGLLDQQMVDMLPKLKPMVVDELSFLLLQAKDEPMFDKVRSIFFNIIINLNLVKQLDVAKLEEAINNGSADEEMISIFVDQILNHMVDGAIKKMGACVGAFTCWHIANYLENKHGPFVVAR